MWELQKKNTDRSGRAGSCWQKAMGTLHGRRADARAGWCIARNGAFSEELNIRWWSSSSNIPVIGAEAGAMWRPTLAVSRIVSGRNPFASLVRRGSYIFLYHQLMAPLANQQDSTRLSDRFRDVPDSCQWMWCCAFLCQAPVQPLFLPLSRSAANFLLRFAVNPK